MPVVADWRPALLALAAVVAALLMGGYLPWALAVGLVTFVGGCWLWAWLLGRNLQLPMQMDEWEASLGDTIAVRMRVDNESILPMTWLEVDDATPAHLAAAQEAHFGTYVPTMGARVFKMPYQIKRRGVYRLGPITARTGDPFGLFAVQKTFHSPKELTVLPRILPVAAPPLPLAQPFGPIRTRQHAFEDPANVAEVRPYHPGDSPRHIHWRSSARLGRWMIRQFELSATTELQIMLDLATSTHFGIPGADSLEEGVDLAAALAHIAYQKGISVSLVAQGSQLHQLPAGRGMRQFRQMLYALARVEADGEVPLAQVLLARAGALPRQGTLVIITPDLRHDLGLTLLRLGNSHATVAWICPPGVPGAEAARTAAMLAERGIQVLRFAPGDNLAPLVSPEAHTTPRGVAP